MYLAVSITKKGLVQYFNDFRRGRISRKEFVQAIKLDPGDEELKAQIIRERDEFLAAVQDDMLEMLRALKRDPKWSELADYYNALRYELNIIDNGLSFEMNELIGEMMIVSQAEIGNTYAIQSFHEYFKYKNQL